MPEDIPAGDVDAALDVRMALERRVHAVIELRQLARVEPDQVRRQLAQARPHAFGVGRQVERPQRADLAEADESRIGFHADDRAVEDRDRLSTRPFVAAFMQRKFDTVGEDALDSHGA